MSPDKAFRDLFCRLTVHSAPHPWQQRLGVDATCRSRLIRIPTGLGKTEGVMAAWLFHRVLRNDPAWPLRLVWCLPMRVLVEQTAAVAERLAEKVQTEGGAAVAVHRLMGGIEAGDWHLEPARPAILIGTQDMLLSRALNRGYAASRARWPMDYGLLHSDALWVMDEVQLMDVGLVTSVQLEAFRRLHASPVRRPTGTWWMSATLQPEWLETAESAEWLPALRAETMHIPHPERTGPLWSVSKPVDLRNVPAKDDRNATKLAAVCKDAHLALAPDVTGRVTLAIVNRVDTAINLHGSLEKLFAKSDRHPQIHLVHSRFRGLERKGWSERFLSKALCLNPATDMIVVATQVVEAGVDISARALVSELAPWPSLVQRFGRAARYGGEASVVVIDRDVTGKNALPYDEADLAAAREAIGGLGGVEPIAIDELEHEVASREPERLRALYRYEPLHVLTSRECRELFDTTPDLTGADLDVSRFIRGGDERDVLVCWIDADGLSRAAAPDPTVQPTRDGLCPVPVYAARDWLFEKGRLREGCLAWTWDYVEGSWTNLTQDDCYPGQVILVDAAWGGYDIERGFTGARRGKREDPVPVAGAIRALETGALADSAQGRDDLSQHAWKTIATHCAEVAAEAAALAGSVGLEARFTSLIELAGRLHDWGKAHPAFSRNIRTDAAGHPGRDDLAKAPPAAWVALNQLYGNDESLGKRRGFRHELASTLALFEVLRRADPDHAALLGLHRALIAAGALVQPPDAEPLETNPLIDEIAALDARAFDLLSYLVCSHHGKVRAALQGTPHDQRFPALDARFSGSGQPLNGVREGDVLPAVDLPSAGGAPVTMPSITLHLDPARLGLSSRYGSSWSERTTRLVDDIGPFTLAYLEALLRAADIRASRFDTSDPLLANPGVTA